MLYDNENCLITHFVKLKELIVSRDTHRLRAMQRSFVALECQKETQRAVEARYHSTTQVKGHSEGA